MQSNTQLINDLCGVQTTNPISENAVDGANIETFPQRDRIQDVILRLALKGQTSVEIAETVGKTVEQVEKVLRAEWATQELEKIAKENPEQQDSLRNFIRIHSFTAVQTVVNLLGDVKVSSSLKLQAARTILEYSLTPAKLDAKLKPQGVDPEKLHSENERLDSEIKRLELQITKPI